MELQTEDAPYFRHFKKQLVGPSNHRLGQKCGTLHHFQLLRNRKEESNNETILQSLGSWKDAIFATVEFSFHTAVRIFIFLISRSYLNVLVFELLADAYE